MENGNLTFLRMNWQDKSSLSNGKLIGIGAFGSVYLFRNDDEEFAVKSIICKTEEQIIYVQRECEVMKRVNHPNIASSAETLMIEHGFQREFRIKMEYCARESLENLLFDKTIIYSMGNATHWAKELFGALVYLNEEHQIIHRDIKPANILVTKDFVLKLADFGCLKESDHTCTGTLHIGTPRYMSPPYIGETPDSKNRLDGEAQVSPKNDVYQVGLVLWEIVERRRVFSEYGITSFDYATFITDIVLMNLGQLESPDCVKGIKEIIQNCSEFNPGLRPSAREIDSRLKNMIVTLESHKEWEDYPIIDEKQKELLKPIGYNSKNNRVPVQTNEFNFSMPTLNDSFSIQQEKENNPKDNYDLSNDLRLGKNRLDFRGQLYLRNLKKKFESLDDIGRANFTSNLPKIINETRAKCLNIFGDHDFPDNIPERQQQELEIDKFLQLILINDHKDKLYLLENSFTRNLYWSKSLFPPWNHSRIGYILDAFRPLKHSFSITKVIFKSYVSLKTTEEWFMVSRSQSLFTRSDFSQQEEAKIVKVNSRDRIFLPNDEELIFDSDRTMDFSVVIQTLVKTQRRIITQTSVLMSRFVSLEESRARTEQIKNPKIGSDLPIPGYISQLRNPPRCECPHNPKCPINYQDIYAHGSNKRNPVQEFLIPLFECTSREELEYLEKWIQMCDDLYFTEKLCQFASLNSETDCSNYFLLEQFVWQRNQDHLTYLGLLDMPINYEDHEEISCFDENLRGLTVRADLVKRLMTEMEPKEKRFLKVVPEKCDSSSAYPRVGFQLLDFEGRILIDSMTEQEQRESVFRRFFKKT